MRASGIVALSLVAAGTVGSLAGALVADEKAPARGALYALAVRLPRRSFPKGEPILLECEFQNRSESPTTIWQSGFWPNHSVVVRDQRGVEPPLTEFGRERRARFSPGGQREKNFPLPVAPGSSFPLAGKGSAIVDLAKLYELVPGRYRVVVTYEERQPPAMKVASDPVEFAVR